MNHPGAPVHTKTQLARIVFECEAQASLERLIGVAREEFPLGTHVVITKKNWKQHGIVSEHCVDSRGVPIFKFTVCGVPVARCFTISPHLLEHRRG